MIDRFEEYLRAIDVTQVMRDRVGEVLTIYARLGTPEPDAIFLSEYLDDEGLRTYESIWIFAADLVMEAKVGEEIRILDQVRMARNLERLVVQRRDYDFDVAHEASRLTIDVSWHGDVTGTFKASGNNCEWLRRLVVERVSPNLA